MNVFLPSENDDNYQGEDAARLQECESERSSPTSENKPPPKPTRRGNKLPKPQYPHGLDFQRFVTLTWTYGRSLRRSPYGERLNKELSPKALYPRPPDMTIDVRRPGNFKTVGAATAAPTSSGGSSGSGSSGGNGFMRVNFNKGGNPSGSKNNNSNNNEGELDLEAFEYPDSPTSNKWLTDNPDLSPLTVLDNINLKTEFPYSSNTTDIDKPPDLSLDTSAENLFQFTATVPPVPDSSTSTFLDNLGNDVFTQSLYDDLVDINLSDFNLVSTTTATNPITQTTNVTVKTTTQNVSPLLTSPLPSTTTITPTLITTHIPDPNTTLPTTKLATDMTLAPANNAQILIPDFSKKPAEFQIRPRQIEIGSLSLSVLPITTQTPVATTTLQPSPPIQEPPQVLKTIVEPLPESALRGLIKIEPEQQIVTVPQAVFSGNNGSFSIKLENNNDMTNHKSEIFTPLKLVTPVSPPTQQLSPNVVSPTPSSGGGKMKTSSTRKKSQSQTTTIIKASAPSITVSDDDDLSNIPSLQTRIQIISQRVCNCS